MSAIDPDANVLSGQPTVYFNDGGYNAVGNGFLNVGNLPTINFDQELETADHKSIHNGEMLKDVSLTISKTLGLTMDFDEFNSDNLNLVFGGDGKTSQVQAGGVIADEKHDAPIILGRSIKTVESDISSFFMEASGGGASYALGIDYEIESASLAMIKILSTGTITSGESGLEFNYTSAAKTKDEISPGKQNQVTGSAIIVINTDGTALNGLPIVWTIQHAVLRHTAGFSVTPGEFATAQLVLEVLVDKLVDSANEHGTMDIG